MSESLVVIVLSFKLVSLIWHYNGRLGAIWQLFTLPNSFIFSIKFFYFTCIILGSQNTYQFYLDSQKSTSGDTCSRSFFFFRTKVFWLGWDFGVS